MLWILLCNILVFLNDDYEWVSQLAPPNSSGPSGIYLAVLTVGSVALSGGTLYIALSTGYRWVRPFAFVGTPDYEYFRSIPLFTLTLVWPAL